jgi:C4-dicarboxylate transporter, DctM subunit
MREMPRIPLTALLMVTLLSGCSLRKLAVNQVGLFLIIVGALMDIYSAIIVVVPVILPLGVAFGIDPIHLGIIFLANLELDYLIPPVGENLFIAAYRFDKPIGELARAVLPMVGVLLAGMLAITYIPALSLWLVR